MVSVTISTGNLRGAEAVTENGYKYYEFLSIPYAKPPIGDLRFKNPQQPESWKGERDATQSVLQNTSAQKNFMTNEITGSEDCLYLNVFTPKLPFSRSKPLPVMFYIHGGGFMYGNGILKEESGPDYLIENDVVVVSINYRVGVFGFLSLDISEAPGNVGLKDQVMALKWVQTNIDKFGGDKNNVTIFGISAGSASVEFLILSPTTKGLFHKAILQSGSALNDWAISFQYEQLTANLADKLGYKGDKNDKRALYEFLMKVPTAELSEAAFFVTVHFTTKCLSFGFVPIVEKIVDGAFITTHPYKILKEGNFVKVPVIRGFCDVEGTVMRLMKPFAINEIISSKTFVDYWSYEFDSGDREKYETDLKNAYLETIKPEDDRDKFAIDFFGDLHFSSGIWLASKLSVRHGITEYVYKFMYEGNLNTAKNMFGLTKTGASHGDDLAYIIKTKYITAQPQDADILMRSNLTKMWTNFAKTSDPTSSGNVDFKWPKFTEQSMVFLMLDKEITAKADHEPVKMAIFEEIYEKYEK